MSVKWETVVLASELDAISALADLQGRRWLCRGHARSYASLTPAIDRRPREHLSRVDKLKLERQSIDIFRASARFFATAGEKMALDDDFIALMVLQHYGVPTRLLDWSQSPYVAAHFAVASDDRVDGEIWAFDEVAYELAGKAQWVRLPETTSDGSGNDSQFAAGLTAFNKVEPSDWIIAIFYPPGFPRQNAQNAAYTATARFGTDHADAIGGLLGDRSQYCRYVIPSGLKSRMRQFLREQHGIWRGSLFPDAAGAAETAAQLFERNQK